MKIPGLIVIAVLCAFTPVLGQIGQPIEGSLIGIVRDASGAVLPGVTVTVAGGPPQAPERRTVVTNREGGYTLFNLPPGTYTLTFTLPGFAQLTTTGVLATGVAPVRLETAMRVAPLRETYAPGAQFLFPPLPQAPRDARAGCLHGPTETDAERDRRLEAFNAMHLIYAVLERVPSVPTGRGYPDWMTLARSADVAALKKLPGARGELANKIQWGAPEPLPGWRIQYWGGISVTYALTDITDPCGFTMSSNDPRVIPPTARTLPLT